MRTNYIAGTGHGRSIESSCSGCSGIWNPATFVAVLAVLFPRIGWWLLGGGGRICPRISSRDGGGSGSGGGSTPGGASRRDGARRKTVRKHASKVGIQAHPADG